MTKVWHISDPHLSFDQDGNILKKMDERKWAIGSWTYENYLDRIADFSSENIKDSHFTFITGDIVHDIGAQLVPFSLNWLRANIKGTIVLCRGNHDKKWNVGDMRVTMRNLSNFYFLDEEEILAIGPYTIGCFSNHREKMKIFESPDSRLFDIAKATVIRAKERKKTPLMISHYPVNLATAQMLGNLGIKAYLSGHIHCTGSNLEGPDFPLNWDSYNASAAQTDDKILNGCFFSTGTTDVVQALHKQSFKEIFVLRNKVET